MEQIAPLDSDALFWTTTYDVLFTLTVVALFHGHDVIVAQISKLIKAGLPRPPPNPELLRLGGEIRLLKGEMEKISPTAEFANYFKKDRQLNKLTDQYNAVLATIDSSKETYSDAKVDVIVRVLGKAIGLILLHSVSGLTAFCIPGLLFWPLNYLLRFPAVWSSEGCGNADSEFVPVSMFVVVYLFVMMLRKSFNISKAKP